MRLYSKSQYVRGQQCPKSLWLYRHRKDLKDPVDMHQQAIFDAGTAFGQLAMQRFPGGVLIKAPHTDPEGALAETAAAVAAGAQVLYEAAFTHDDVLVRVDIMFREKDGPWTLVEVKSATKLDPVYLLDVAIQRHVLRGAGVPVNRAILMHANPGYVRYGALDLVKLFLLQDVGALSEDALAAVPSALKALKAQADAPEPPAVAIGEHCSKPYDCDFRGLCWQNVPEYSVFDIPYLKFDKKRALYEAGVKHVHEVDPATHGVTDKRSLRPIEVARRGAPAVDVPAITAFLRSLVYPIAHLDFEADNPVIPPYDGLRPYAQMPFQASVRVQHAPGGPVDERVFLGDGLRDPRHELVSFLLAQVPNRGSVLAYYKPYEGARLEELASWHGRATANLTAIKERLVDLADPFSKGWYTHPGFLGRWSIKNVLPVLVPELGYGDLAIKNGAEAMAAYGKLKDPALPEAERARLYDALLAYCGRDTMAMVKILDHLYAVTGARA